MACTYSHYNILHHCCLSKLNPLCMYHNPNIAMEPSPLLLKVVSPQNKENARKQKQNGSDKGIRRALWNTLLLHGVTHKSGM